MENIKKPKQCNSPKNKVKVTVYVPFWLKQRMKKFKNQSLAVEEALIAHYGLVRPGPKSSSD